MKKLLLGVCLAALGVACRSSGANMSDSSENDCTDCSSCSEKSGTCTGEGHCEEAKTCPATGKSIN